MFLKAKERKGDLLSNDSLSGVSGGWIGRDSCGYEFRVKFTSDEANELRKQGYDIRPARVYTRSDLNKKFQTDASSRDELIKILERKLPSANYEYRKATGVNGG